ncbi:MAG TPA: PSP1 C-terminal domain-containing protein [Gemmataceae bacterium]|nr:PSP1 C-terminal domain-containing protein [Gemmataceae bacterium]
MSQREYLMSYGNAGDFGRFGSETPLECRRGDRLVVRSHRGQELAVVIRQATEQHAAFLAEQFVGLILRRATAGDLALAEQMRRKSQTLFADARRLVGELSLSLEILDAEILLDGRQAVIHHLRWAECDPRPLMDQVAQQYHLLVSFHDLAVPVEKTSDAEHGGCGAPGCTSGEGGCGSCGSGGCSTCAHQHVEAAPHTDARPMVSLFSGNAGQ